MKAPSVVAKRAASSGRLGEVPEAAMPRVAALQKCAGAISGSLPRSERSGSESGAYLTPSAPKRSETAVVGARSARRAAGPQGAPVGLSRGEERSDEVRTPTSAARSGRRDLGGRAKRVPERALRDRRLCRPTEEFSWSVAEGKVRWRQSSLSCFPSLPHFRSFSGGMRSTLLMYQGKMMVTAPLSTTPKPR